MSIDKVSTNNTIKKLFKYISDDKKEAIDYFFLECLNRKYTEYKDREMALMSIETDYNNTDMDVFNNWSGYNFRNINNTLRNKWNYEENGHIDKKADYEQIAIEMKNTITNNQKSIGNVKVFRGVSIDYFKDYGINNITDLLKLKGNFLFDKGFVSTSLVEDECFYKKENELGIDYNVKIEYLIPEEFEDGICISNVSYSPNQCEYLINSNNLAKVIDVNISNEDATVKAMLIPKKVYDHYYSYNTGSVK